MRGSIKRATLGALCAMTLALGVAPSAQAAFDDPLFVLRPEKQLGFPPLPPAPPPVGTLEGPCGLAVDASGAVYVSDYYHHAVDLFEANPPLKGGVATYPYGYLSQIPNEDLLDGPCATALDSAGHLYVNNFHRNVVRFTTSPFDAGTVIVGAPLNAIRPTGVAVNKSTNDVYVNERTQVAVFDSAGAPKGTIGTTTLGDGYGLAVSEFPATAGRIYVPDAGSQTVKVYAPGAAPTDPPVATIDGSGTPAGHFTSLRNSAIAIDKVSGEIYVADTLRPEFSELSETAIYVFASSGTYEGRLKFSIENALPPGLAVDNSATATQGRVYVTTGNTVGAAVYAYPAHAATSSAVPLAQPMPPGGVGGGSAPEAPEAALATIPTPAAATLAVARGEGGTAPSPAPRRATRHRHNPKHAHRHHRHARKARR